MFSKYLEKITETDDVSCFELKTNSGVIITTIGQKGLNCALETLARLGLFKSIQAEADIEPMTIDASPTKVWPTQTKPYP